MTIAALASFDLRCVYPFMSLNSVRAANYHGNQYWLEPNAATLTGLDTTTRASPAWLYNGATWIEFLANVAARIDGIGMYVGGQFTNKIRNPRGEGGVVGTVGVTNKCTGYNAAPPTTAGLSVVGGDGTTTLTVVDDTAALQAIAASDPFISAGFANGWLNGKAFRLNNSSAASAAAVVLAGSTGNTNVHTAASYIRGSAGDIRASNGVGGVTAFGASATYVRRAGTFTPSDGIRNGAIQIAAGADIYFILNDLTETATAAPVPTVVAGAAATARLPTNWQWTASSSGLAVAFLGSGTANGIPYSRWRIYGTATGGATCRLSFDATTYAAISQGQAFGADFGVRLVAGVGSNCRMRLETYASGSGITNYNGSTIVIDDAIQRVWNAAIAQDAAVTSARAAYAFASTAGVAYDFTFDIFAPKLVQLAVIEGPELVTNGDFASGTGWSFTGAGWSIGTGKANAVAAPNGNRVYSIIPAIEASGVVKTVFTVSNYTNGSAGLRLSTGGASTDGTARTANGTYTEYLSGVAANTALSIYARAMPSNLSVDDVSVKLVTPGYMPAFPILPPVGVIADSTKFAEDIKAASFTWFTAAGLSVGATQMIVPNFSHVSDGVFRYLFEYSDGTLNNRIAAYVGSDDKPALRIVVGGVTLAMIAHPTAIGTGRKPFAFGWGPDGIYITNGTTTEAAAAVALPTVTQLRLGGAVAATNFLNDVIEQVQGSNVLPSATAAAWALAA